ncbi:MAG: tRNA threonylcarbamoyladenosine dehydratase [bacterium]
MDKPHRAVGPGDDSAPPAGKSAHSAVPKKFDRLARLVGGGGIEKLLHSHVAVIGLGGVGSYVAEGLARSGVGRLTLVDFDEVCVTNFNRQLHAVEGNIGKAKAVLMESRVLAINPRCEVRSVLKFYEKVTSEEILSPAPDIVVDCIDNLTAKLHLLFSCVERGIPVVSSLGASGRLDPTRISVAPLTDTYADPLGQALRKNLRRKYKMPDEAMEKVVAVFSDEPPTWPVQDYRSSLCGTDCVCPNAANQHHTCQRRHVIHGSSVFVTATFGMVAAAAVVRHLAGLPPIQPRPDSQRTGYVHRRKKPA